MARESFLHIPIDEVVVSYGRRQVDPETVKRLAVSIKEIGLQHPISVRSHKGQFILIAGRHRLEAMKALREDRVPANVIKFDEVDAELWEISENLHRAELTQLERSENVARWRELRAQKVRTLSAPIPGGLQVSDLGNRKTAADLGIDEKEVRNAGKIAALTDEAKEAARQVGLDDNRSALLEAARAEPIRQASVIREVAEHKASRIDADVKDRAAKEVAEIISEHVPGDLWDALKANLYAAGANNIANALTNITGQSIMDRRYAQ